MLSSRTKRELKVDQRQILIDSIEIGIPSTQQILTWGERVLPNGKKVGLIKNSKTVNYKRFTPFRDGLFCERIFGPVTSFVCACGKKQPHSKITFCEKCEVEYIDQRSRRYRLGYISLLSPVTHIWYLKGRPSYLSLFLGKRKKTIVALAYCNAYLVEHGASTKKGNSVKTGHVWPSMTLLSSTKNFLQDVEKKSSNLVSCSPNSSEAKTLKKLCVHANLVRAYNSASRVACHFLRPSSCVPLLAPITKRAIPLIAPICVPCGARANFRFAKGQTRDYNRDKYLHAVQIQDLQRGTCKGCKGERHNKQRVARVAGAEKKGVKFNISISNCSRSQENTKPARKHVKALFYTRPLSTKILSSLYTLDKTDGEIKNVISKEKARFNTKFFENFLTQNFKKKEWYLSTSYGTYLYARQHTLPFLPSLISHFYLRDALLNFIYSSPAYDDIPLMEYCHTKRWEPLRDVHKFMAHRTVEVDLSNFTRVSKKNLFKKSVIFKESRAYKTYLDTSHLPYKSEICMPGLIKDWQKDWQKDCRCLLPLQCPSASALRTLAPSANLLAYTFAPLWGARVRSAYKSSICKARGVKVKARRLALGARATKGVHSFAVPCNCFKRTCTERKGNQKDIAYKRTARRTNLNFISKELDTAFHLWTSCLANQRFVQASSCPKEARTCKGEKHGKQLSRLHLFLTNRRFVRPFTGCKQSQKLRDLFDFRFEPNKPLLGLKNKFYNQHKKDFNDLLISSFCKSKRGETFSEKKPNAQGFALANNTKRLKVAPFIDNKSQVKKNKSLICVPKGVGTSLSGLELTAIREILSYTGGGALQQLLQQFDQHDLCKFLFAEAQILRVLYETHLVHSSNSVVSLSFTDPFFSLSGACKPYLPFQKSYNKKFFNLLPGGISSCRAVPLYTPCLTNRRFVRASNTCTPCQSSCAKRTGVTFTPYTCTPLGCKGDASALRASRLALGTSVLPLHPFRVKRDTCKGERQRLSFCQSNIGTGTCKQARVKGGLERSRIPQQRKHELPNKVNDLRRKAIVRISRRIYKIARRLKVTQLLTRNHRRPEWMILSHLPVLPPDLRPILQMSEKVIVASDLNIMYQRVIYRNNRHLRVRFIDFHLVTAIQRLVQDAVDRLIENGKGGSKPYYTQGGRPLKSLSDILKGKKGRFRLNLLGKRVDFSGRSVIVVSPSCKIHECGLPKDIALELYHYFLLRQLIIKKHCASIVTAKKMIKSKSSLMWDILRELMYHHPVLLNRAPTLHRLGIQAFQPRLVLGNAILLHPLVCSGFNADFDGDQMGVHLPLSFAARAESWDLLWSRNNLLSPATGQPMLVPSQDMVLGFYYITAQSIQNLHGTTTEIDDGYSFNKKSKNLYKRKTSVFLSSEEITTQFQNGNIKLHTPVWLHWNGKIENEEISQVPLELRVHCFGVEQSVYEKCIYSNFFTKAHFSSTKMRSYASCPTPDKKVKEIYSERYNDLSDTNVCNPSFSICTKAQTYYLRTTAGRILMNNLLDL